MGQKALAFLIGIAMSASAQAESSLSGYLKQEIAALDEAIASCPAEAQAQGEDGWWFRRFWLRARGKIGFTAGDAIKVEIVPEVELLWERPYPDGWTTYKPAS